MHEACFAWSPGWFHARPPRAPNGHMRVTFFLREDTNGFMHETFFLREAPNGPTGCLHEACFAWSPGWFHARPPRALNGFMHENFFLREAPNGFMHETLFLREAPNGFMHETVLRMEPRMARMVSCMKPVFAWSPGWFHARSPRAPNGFMHVFFSA